MTYLCVLVLVEEKVEVGSEFGFGFWCGMPAAGNFRGLVLAFKILEHHLVFLNSLQLLLLLNPNLDPPIRLS